jgi:hypothetical protein
MNFIKGLRLPIEKVIGLILKWTLDYNSDFLSERFFLTKFLLS